MRTPLKKNHPQKIHYYRVIGAFVIFFAGFELSHLLYQEDAFAAFTIVPIAVGAWYFGVIGGLLVALFSILTFPLIHILDGTSPTHQFSISSIIVGDLMFIIAALVFGRFGAVARERKNALDALALSHKLVYSLLEVTNRLSKTLSPEEIAQTLDDELSKLKIAHVIALYESHKGFELKYSSLTSETVTELEKDFGISLNGHAFTLTPDTLQAYSAEPIVVQNLQEEIRPILPFGHQIHFDQFLNRIGIGGLDTVLFRLPLVLEANLLGVVWLWGDQLAESDLPVMSIFSQQISLSLERARLFQEVQELALTDSLTNLPNRRSLFEIGRIEFMRALRLNYPFSCLMLDLDHFKQVNDTYGHPIGDTVLKEFAHRCKATVRDIDMPMRYGGEEFVILLPDTSLEAATQAAERLREEIARKPIKLNDFSISITASIGVSTKDNNTTDLETLIARADQAMYVAKHKGRNRVAISR